MWVNIRKMKKEEKFKLRGSFIEERKVVRSKFNKPFFI